MADNVIECSTACTVTVQLSPAPPSADDVADITAVAGILLVALAGVWGAKQLLNLVTKDES